MSVIHASSESFKEDTGSGLALVDFYADWCGPCKMIAPVLDELSKELTDVKIVKVNVDVVSDIAQQYNIMSIPTLMMFKDGNPVETKMGFQSKDMLVSWINQHK